MRSLFLAAVVSLALLPSSSRGQAIIEIRKVRTLVDRDGKGFTRAPFNVEALSDGRYALSETNEAPMVVDSTGRLIKRFVRGEGPGEFEVPGTRFQLGAGDTLYAPNAGKINLYDRNLKFIRAIPLTSLFGGAVLPMREGFIMVSRKNEAPAHMTSVHVMSPAGTIVRSFVRDTFDRRAWPPPSYRVARTSGDAVWVASMSKHRFEKWTLDGRQLGVIDTQPAWFPKNLPTADGFPTVLDIEEAAGVLWVMSSIPVPDYRARMAKILGGGSGEVDARKIPDEELSTAYLAAYDATTGKLLADLPLKTFGIGLLGGGQYMVYRAGSNGEAQLEVWEMKLRRP